jgi:hypothetical protein
MVLRTAKQNRHDTAVLIMDRVLSRALLKQPEGRVRRVQDMLMQLGRDDRLDYAESMWAFASGRLTRVDAGCLADVVTAVASLPGGGGTMTAHRAVFACIKQPMPPMRIQALYSAWIKGRLVAFAGTTPARTSEQLKEAFTRFSKEALAFGKERGLDPESPILKASLGAVGAVLDEKTLAQWEMECGLPRAATAAERADAKR